MDHEIKAGSAGDVGVDMAIIRVHKDEKYFVASNEPFNDARLSWEARGVMGYLLSKFDGWTVRLADLYKQGPAGWKTIKRILKELESAGYLVRERVHNENGTFEWVSTIYESPSLNPKVTIVPKPSDGSRYDILTTDGILGQQSENESGNGKTGKEKKVGAQRIKDKQQKQKQCAPRLTPSADKKNDKFSSSSSADIELTPELEKFKSVTGFIPADDKIQDVTQAIREGSKNGELRDAFSLHLYRGLVGKNHKRKLENWFFDLYAQGGIFYLQDHERWFLEIPADYDFLAGVSKNPAIAAYKAVVGVWPCRQLYGRIANFWDGFDYDYLLDEFTKRRAAWLELGYSKTSYGWLFDLWPSFMFRTVKEPLSIEELEPVFLEEV